MTRIEMATFENAGRVLARLHELFLDGDITLVYSRRTQNFLYTLRIDLGGKTWVTQFMLESRHLIFSGEAIAKADQWADQAKGLAKSHGVEI